MIRPEDIRNLQTREPFQPFKMHLSDGRTFQIRHPELVMVFKEKVVIGLPETAEIPERSETCSLLHVTSLEEVPA